MSNLKSFVGSILYNGGATYSLQTGELNPDAGYMVSLKGHQRIIKPENFKLVKQMEHEIKNYVSDFATCLMNEGNFLGAWIEEGKLYLDVSRKLDSSIQAYTLAIKNQQLAYYDNVKKESVYIKHITEPGVPEAKTLEEIEEAIFKGFKRLKYNGKVFDLPSLQKSGTMQQNRDYVYLKAKEILFYKLQ